MVSVAQLMRLCEDQIKGREAKRSLVEFTGSGVGLPCLNPISTAYWLCDLEKVTSPL